MQRRRGSIVDADSSCASVSQLDQALRSGGRWVRSNNSRGDPLPDYGWFRFHGRWSLPEAAMWSWVPPDEAPTCTLTRVTSDRICRTLAALNLTRITYVGDSTTRTMFESLIYLLHADKAKEISRGNAVTSVTCRGGTNVSLQLILNDLLFESFGLWNRTSTCRRACACPGTVKRPCVPFLHDYVFDTRSTLLVISAGAHYREVQPLTKAVDGILHALAEATKHATLYERSRPVRDYSRDLLVWRAAAGGHDNCLNFNRPFASAEDAPAFLTYLWQQALAPNGSRARHYAWDLLPQFNKVARRSIANATWLPMRTQFLDVEPMSALRGDGHRAFVNAAGVADCMHYKLPGVVDWYNAALLAVLNAVL